jgi:hypothetical protein
MMVFLLSMIPGMMGSIPPARDVSNPFYEICWQSGCQDAVDAGMGQNSDFNNHCVPHFQ